MACILINMAAAKTVTDKIFVRTWIAIKIDLALVQR